MLTKLRYHGSNILRYALTGLLFLASSVVLLAGIFAATLVAAALALFAVGYAALRGRRGGDGETVADHQPVIPGSYSVVRVWRVRPGGDDTEWGDRARGM